VPGAAQPKPKCEKLWTLPDAKRWASTGGH
jgi:hypothetical protein